MTHGSRAAADGRRAGLSINMEMATPTPTPFAVPHFTTGAFAPHCTRLCDDVYAQVLDNVTKCCCDVIITDARGQLLLGRRCVRAPHLASPRALLNMASLWRVLPIWACVACMIRIQLGGSELTNSIVFRVGIRASSPRPHLHLLHATHSRYIRSATGGWRAAAA